MVRVGGFALCGHLSGSPLADAKRFSAEAFWNSGKARLPPSTDALQLQGYGNTFQLQIQILHTHTHTAAKVYLAIAEDTSDNGTAPARAAWFSHKLPSPGQNFGAESPEANCGSGAWSTSSAVRAGSALVALFLGPLRKLAAEPAFELHLPPRAAAVHLRSSSACFLLPSLLARQKLGSRSDAT